jgi:hypothetical protein
MKAVSLQDPSPLVADVRDFPTVEVSQRERSNRALDPETHERAWHLFYMWGVVRWLHVFEPAFMAELAGHYRQRYRDKMRSTDKEDRRPLFTPKLSGPFAEDTYHSNPLLFPIIVRALGDDVVLGAAGSVVSFPGAPLQFIHRDSASLYDDYTIDVRLPPYALTVLMPLIDANQQTGSTRVWPGTHRVASFEQAQAMPSAAPDVPAGSMLMVDSRTLHCGAPNRSEIVRPLVYNSYHRCWYRDLGGYDYRPPVHVGAVELARLPRDKRGFFRISREKSPVERLEWQVRGLAARALQGVRALRRKGS